ncbi:zinc knuckle (CCHC-type) family protein [Striga hermonthica]|uniref:Zinc knuckle (CCHC-type) family protein n=1 Tax=Striga hermonthica TaxID=68872 RepID=A0A9N7NVJ0_STRHE|nr:zinc knuckle (CCHC-type) family protein [Striga hermonthica]
MSFVTGSVDCYCGRRAVIRTSWTNENPGRRFHACLKKEEGGGCVFFDWYDPPMCRRAKSLILGLLKKMNASEEEILKLKAETLSLAANNRKLKKIILVLVLLVVSILIILKN